MNTKSTSKKEMFLKGKEAHLLRSTIVESYNLDALFSSIEKNLDQKIREMILNFSDEEQKGMLAAYVKICEIVEYRFRVFLMSSFYDYLVHLVEKEINNESESLKKEIVENDDEPSCLSFEQLVLDEKTLDSMVKAKIGIFSEELHHAFAETYETISSIKNIYNRKVMKYDFYTYLDSCVGIQEKDIYCISYEQLGENEKQVDSTIKTKINMFSEESKEGLAETYEKLCSIKNVYNRKVMKDNFYNYLESCEELMDEE